MFSRDELSSLNQEYFIVHNATCYNIVLESRNTGHFWSITGSGYRNSVTLQHKHKGEYEWHDQAFYIKTRHDLQGAILAIKEHDAYYLSHSDT